MSLKQLQKKNDRKKVLNESLSQSIGKVPNGFFDNNMNNPPKNLYGKSTSVVNTNDRLETFGTNIPCDVQLSNEKQYGKYYNYTTPAGHVIEYNDTPGSERILFKHKNGTGINIGPDGTVLISSNQRVDVINDMHTLSVTGDGELTYEGNLTINVKGNFNVNVGGEYNVRSNKTSVTTNGPAMYQTNGEHNLIVNGNKSESITGTSTNTILDKYNVFAKNDTQIATEGKATFATKGIAKFTSEEEVIITSPDMNIAATNMSLFGHTGTIGGEEIIMYNENMYTGKSIWSNTVETKFVHTEFASWTRAEGDVVGNLEGTADDAIRSVYASKASIAGGISVVTPPSHNITAPEYADSAGDTRATALPTNNLLQDYINSGSKGVCKINIDPAGVLKDYLDYTNKNGKVANRELTEQEIRQQLRDPSNRNNSQFISTSLSDGKLSSDFKNNTADNIEFSRATKKTIAVGQTKIGNVNPATVAKKIKAT